MSTGGSFRRVVKGIRNSFKRKKGRARGRQSNEFDSPLHGSVRTNTRTEIIIAVSSDEVKSVFNTFSSFLRNLSKTVDKNRKKDRSGSRIQTDYSTEYTKLEKHIVDVKKCFQDLVNYDEGYAQHDTHPERYRRTYDDYDDERYARHDTHPGRHQRTYDDDDGGFNRQRTNPATGTSKVTVHMANNMEINDRTTDQLQHIGRDQRSSDERNQLHRARSVDDRKTKKIDYRIQEELRIKEQTIENLQKKHKEELQRYERELLTERKSREDAQRRLSQMMGKQLMSNNPAITDLSDPHRSLNLAEDFSNIYDNEWTDAIEDLEKIVKDEKTTISILLSVVTGIYSECYDLRYKGTFVVGFENRSAKITHRIRNVPDECKILLKSVEMEQLTSLKKAMLSKLSSECDRRVIDYLSNSRNQYLTKCLQLCWIMVCQSPPIHLEWNYECCSFDVSILKPFTENGDTIHYLVWPVMFLHKDGPLLNKGVAQGCYSSRHTEF